MPLSLFSLIREMVVRVHVMFSPLAETIEHSEKEFLFLTYCNINTNGQQVNDNNVRASSHQEKVNAKFLQV